MSILSSVFASLASAFSGAETSATWLWHFDDVECPKELIK